MYEIRVSHVPSTFPVSLSLIVLPVSKLCEPKKKALCRHSEICEIIL